MNCCKFKLCKWEAQGGSCNFRWGVKVIYEVSEYVSCVMLKGITISYYEISDKLVFQDLLSI